MLYHNKLIVHNEKGINLPKKSLLRLWMTQNIINVSVIQNFKFYNEIIRGVHVDPKKSKWTPWGPRGPQSPLIDY